MLNFKILVLIGLAGQYRKFLGVAVKIFGDFTRPTHYSNGNNIVWVGETDFTFVISIHEVEIHIGKDVRFVATVVQARGLAQSIFAFSLALQAEREVI